MELVKNIFFNTDKLVENNLVKISYTGMLFQNNAEKVFIHYGFGNNWDCLSEVEMTKTELGFQSEIRLVSSESLNLCFRTNNNEWDNNNSSNYSFVVEPAPLALTLVNDSKVIYPRKLRKSYLWSKKIKLAFYRFIRYFPKLLTGNESNSTSSD